MQRELKAYIDDIMTAIKKIEKYVAEMTKEDLIKTNLFRMQL